MASYDKNGMRNASLEVCSITGLSLEGSDTEHSYQEKRTITVFSLPQS